MNRIFSQHVKSLADGHGVDDVQGFDAAWEKLGDALQSEMMQRGMWSTSPSYLGVVGYVSWSQEEAFFELQSDCYTFSFVRRLPGLNALLENQDNIEGVVFRNIRNFLFELQKRHDPLGYRVFRVLRSAADQLMDEERLVCSNASGKIANDSILAFSSDVEGLPATREVLETAVEPWGPSLLPDLVVRRGKRLERVVEVLCQHIVDLETQGIDSLRFKDLAQILKGHVRRTWSAMWQSQGNWARDDGPEEERAVVPWVQPDLDFEGRSQFHYLRECVDEAIDTMETRSTTRRYLDRLWAFLCGYAAEALPMDDSAEGSGMPSNRNLAEILDIPRYRLPDLWITLGTFVQGCQGTRH